MGVPRLSSIPAFRPWFRAAALLALAAVTATLAAAQEPASERQERFIGPGVRLKSWSRPEGPHALYAVEASREESFVQFGVSLGGGEKLALEPISKQADRLTRPDRYPIAGVNGDFFYYPNTTNPGIPTNAAVMNGELIRSPFPRSSLVLTESGPSIRILKLNARVRLQNGAERALDGVNQPRGQNQLVLYTPRFGGVTRTPNGGIEVYLEPESFPLNYAVTEKARVRTIAKGDGGAVIADNRWVLSGSGTAAAFLQQLAVDDNLEIRAEFDPPLGPRDQVLGGGPRLVRDGRPVVEMEGGSIGGSFASTRHPRTAIGYNAKSVFLLVVDGRQPGYSEGMSLPELAQAMADLGCTDAINMDGGGSSALWARGSIVNRPSDGRERSVANGLLVFSTAPKGDPVRLTPTPAEILALPGAEVPLMATGEDRFYNPVAFPADQAKWTVHESLGTITNGRFRARDDITPDAGQDFASGLITGEVSGVQGTLPVKVFPRPARVEVTPAVARVATAVPTVFRLRAVDSQGRPLTMPASAVTWTASPETGRIGSDGVLVSSEGIARGTVTATVYGVSGTASVEVDPAFAKALEDFETCPNWAVRLSPVNVFGAVSLANGLARSGKRSLRLDYDFSTTSGTRAVYALGTRTLGRPLALKLWAYGDGQGAWLRVRVRDAQGKSYLLDAARNVDWKDTWRELRVPISEDYPTPVTLDAIYVVEADEARKPKGTVYLDDISVEG